MALLFLRSQYALHRIRCALGRIVIVADLEFAEQPQRDQLHAGDDEHGGEEHQRPVLRHDVAVVDELGNHHPERNAHAGGYTGHADGPEEMQRARQVPEQEPDGQEIEEDAEGARDAVVRDAAFAVHVLDRNFTDRGTMPRSESWDKAVHLAIQRHEVQQVASIGFKRSAEVVDVDAAQLGHQPVGAARGEAAQHEVVDANLAPAGNDVEAFVNFLDEQRNIVGIVLEVAIHGEHVIALRVVKSRCEGGGLAEVAPQLYDYDT